VASALVVSSLHSLKLILDRKGWQFGGCADALSIQYLGLRSSFIKILVRLEGHLLTFKLDGCARKACSNGLVPTAIMLTKMKSTA
jgi:hypothetical protein